jgi:hypothetical protein
MAKRAKFRYAGARPIVVRSSSRPAIVKVSAPRPLAGRARRAAIGALTAAGRAAAEEKHRLYAVGAAFAIGYAEKEGWDLPHIDLLGVPASWGLGLWILQKAGVVKNKSLSHATTGLLSVAAYKFGSGDTVLKLK